MDRYCSTEEAARHFGVSRSTIKRFCDQTEGVVCRTPGGHRRINLEKLTIAFQLSGGRHCGTSPTDVNVDETIRLLLLGDATALFSKLLQSSITQYDWPRRIEESIVPALWRVGDLWSRNLLTVAEQKVASTTAGIVLDALLSQVANTSYHFSVVGGTPSGSPDTTASKIVTLIARINGIQAYDLGCDCSPEYLAEALQVVCAQAVWVSYTHISDVSSVVTQHETLRALIPTNIRIFIGGGALSPSIRRLLPGSVYCETIQHMIDDLKHGEEIE